MLTLRLLTVLALGLVSNAALAAIDALLLSVLAEVEAPLALVVISICAASEWLVHSKLLASRHAKASVLELNLSSRFTVFSHPSLILCRYQQADHLV